MSEEQMVELLQSALEHHGMFAGELVAREGLTTKVHQRLNVRVLELIHEDSDSRIELEGSRLPATHSKDVTQALSV